MPQAANHDLAISEMHVVAAGPPGRSSFSEFRAMYGPPRNFNRLCGLLAKRVAAQFDEIQRADVCKAEKEKAFEGSERFAIQ